MDKNNTRKSTNELITELVEKIRDEDKLKIIYYFIIGIS